MSSKYFSPVQMSSMNASKYLSSNSNGSSRYPVNIYSAMQMGSADGIKYLSSISNGSSKYVISIYSPEQMDSADGTKIPIVLSKWVQRIYSKYLFPSENGFSGR